MDRAASPTCLARMRVRREPERGALHAPLREHLATLLVRAALDCGPAHPRFVARELRGYLACGILAFGFARPRCPQCGQDELVAFSCKGRGFCPSCGGRRMTESAAHLVDEVLPDVPLRQWVLSFPYPVRFALDFDPKLSSAVRRSFVRALMDFLRGRAARRGIPGRSSGAVVLAQRFGSALNLNLHFHADRTGPGALGRRVTLASEARRRARACSRRSTAMTPTRASPSVSTAQCVPATSM